MTYNTQHNINAVGICFASYCLGYNNNKKPVHSIHAVHFKNIFHPRLVESENIDPVDRES